MPSLILDRAQLEVKSEGHTLALYEAGQRQATVPIKHIDRCIIHGSQTKLDSGVLMKLAEAGVTTVLMSPRLPRRVAIVLGPRHNDAAVRLAQASLVLNEAACRQWALALVQAKIERQQRALKHWLLQRPDARKPLWNAQRSIEAVLAGLRQASADTPAPLNRLRGLEGCAARAYFGGLAAVMPAALGFEERNRRPPRDPVNVCLSLGYTLLHSQAVQACTIAGLDPMLGFYHRPAVGRESLACDLIEPLRPVVDRWVWHLLQQRLLREEHFSLDKGACLLGKAGRAVFYDDWERASKPMRRWLQRKAAAMAQHLRGVGHAWLLSSNDADVFEPPPVNGIVKNGASL